MLSTACLFVLLDLLVAVLGQGYNSQRCSSSRLSDCRKSIEDSIGKRINDMGRQDMIRHCGVIRGDFNCMLKEMRCLTDSGERQRNADILRKGFTYLRDGCDNLGGSWKEISCYTGDGMKNCEDSYPVSNGQYSSYTTEACRKFNQYEECVNHVMRNRCRPDEEKHVGQYLVAKVQDLAWNCGETDSDRNRNRDYDRERDSGRSDRYDSRDRNRDQGRYQGDYGSDSYDRNRQYDSANSSRGYDSSQNLGSGDITCCRNERCDSNRMQQCRSSLTRTVDNRNGGYQEMQKCRKARDDFNCLLWQTTCLAREERDRISELFHRARDYISRNCDTYGRWSENSCYKSSEMQRCETQLSSTRGGANYESCRAYTSFRDCMTEELRRRCTREDELLQGAYLVDKAQEMSWQCSNENTGMGSYYDRDRDRNQDSSYRGSYDRSYDRDRDRDSRGRYDSGSYTPYGSYEESPHLSDDDAMCLSRMQTPADNCRNEMNEKRRRLITDDNYDRKERGNCCAAINFRRCLLDASRRVCSQERGAVVESLLGRSRYDMNSEKCRGYYERDCSGASVIQLSAMLIILTLASFLVRP